MLWAHRSDLHDRTVGRHVQAGASFGCAGSRGASGGASARGFGHVPGRVGDGDLRVGEGAKTEESENEQYSRLLEIADLILAYIAEETSSQNCRLVTGLALASVDVVPEASVFGGWSGYSIELSFE